ncbi:MAG TPA: TPM domain-containing protein [Chitinophagaceae bacterium]|nr:TPM domain-containing protein [Chitinophagaceae bacterium]
MFSLFKKKEFFSKEENDKIIAAIRHAEECTSGEVRVFVERRCKFIDPLDRAMEIFSELKMQNTKDRNAVLVYVAIKDRQLAIYGDSGINAKTGEVYWKQEVDKMVSQFNKENYADGISSCVTDIGLALQTYFPYDKETDKNELPDEIIFG